MSNAAARPPEGWVERRPAFILYLYRVWVIIGLETFKMMRDPTEILSRSIQPALWLLLFGEAFSKVRVLPEGSGDYLAFLTPGILAQAITFVSIFNGLAIIWEKDMGILQKILTTPISRSGLVLGKMLASTVRSLSQLAVILALARILGIHLQWSAGRAAGLLVLVVLGSAFFTGLSMVIAAIVRTRERMMGIGQLVTMPLFFASSALYPVSIMPGWLQVFARVNPMSYLVDGLRSLLLDPNAYPIGLDAGVLFLAAILIWAVATVQYPRLLY